MFSVVSFATVVVGSVTVVDYKLTRYKVESRQSSKNEIVYNHQDAKTTHLINVLAGKEKLNATEKDEIKNAYLRELRKSNPGLNQKELENETSKFDFESELSPETFDSELYNALWKIEQECGNPKIRICYGNEGLLPALHVESETSTYNPYLNTVSINLKGWRTTINKFFAELSHGKQFSDNPASSFFGGLKDYAKTLKRYALGDEVNATYDSLAGSYGQLYGEPGTLENEAHEIIEPKIRSRFRKLTPQRTAKEIEEESKIEDANKKNQEQIGLLKRDQYRAEGKLRELQRGEIVSLIIQKEHNKVEVSEQDIRKIREKYDQLIEQSNEEFEAKIKELRKDFRLSPRFINN